MAFPVIASVTASSFGTDATAHLVAMPATVDANDLLIVGFANDGSATVTTPGGWTLIQSDANSTAARLSSYYKIAVGNEDGTTVDFVTSATEKAAAQVYRITAASWHGTTPPETAAAATGGGAGPDPPSTNPAGWNVEDTLWIAMYGADDDDDASTYPTNYTNGTYTQSDNSNASASMGSARRELAAASDDPGIFTIAAGEEWITITLAIRPSGSVTLTGVLFTKAPAFFTGVITTTVSVSGVLFTKAPAFFTGTISAQYTLSGVLFSQAPTFFTGAITTQNTLSGTLFVQAPTFPTGAITAIYALGGALFAEAPTFFTGAITQAFTLSGVLFAEAPTFPTGVITAGPVTLSGVLFSKTPSFFVGTISTQTQLVGILFAMAPVFPTGVISQPSGSQTLTGVLFAVAPGFFVGIVSGGTVVTPPFGAGITDGGRRARISGHDRSLVLR